jgi:hypothetical protein
VHRWRPAAYLAVLMAGEFVIVLTIAAIVRQPIPAARTVRWTWRVPSCSP